MAGNTTDPAALPPTQLPANVLRSASEVAQVLGSLPPTWETRMELRVPGSNLGPASAAAPIWGVSQWTEDLSLALSSLSVTLLFKEIDH